MKTLEDLGPMAPEYLDVHRTIRLAAGHESDNGKLDPYSTGYWFNEMGNLVMSHFWGCDMTRTSFVDFGSVRIARRLQLMNGDGVLVQDIRIRASIPWIKRPPTDS